jgi:hypothetical protein
MQTYRRMRQSCVVCRSGRRRREWLSHQTPSGYAAVSNADVSGRLGISWYQTSNVSAHAVLRFKSRAVYNIHSKDGYCLIRSRAIDLISNEHHARMTTTSQDFMFIHVLMSPCYWACRQVVFYVLSCQEHHNFS